MITSNATHVINSLCGMYNVNDPGGAYRDAPTVQLGEMGNSPAPGGANGLIGLSRPWGGTIVTGTKYGPIRVTVEVHDTRPPADGIDDYSDVVELDFTVVSGRVVLTDWDGEPFYDLIVSSGNWRCGFTPGAPTRAPPVTGTPTTSPSRSTCSSSSPGRSWVRR
ncbi:MAG: hypothetical protein M3163_11225 [Actinomycetota bacterium]|nr:hypothetical protein [Actinomycetota bacterium]